MDMRSDGDAASHARDWNLWITSIALLCVTSLATFLRLRLINVESLWMDEAASMHFARQPLMDLLGLVYEYESNPPLHYLVLHASIALFGDTAFAGRFPSAVSGILTVPAVYMLARQFTSRLGALVAAAFLSLSWVHIYYSVEARAYALLILLAVLSSHSLLNVISTPRRRWVLSYTICAMAMIWTHYYALTVFFAHALAVTTQLKQPTVLKRFAASIVAIVLAGAPLIPWVLRTSRRLTSDRVPPELSEAVRQLNVYCDYAGNWVVLVMLAPITAVAILSRSARSAPRLLLAGLLTLPVLFPWVLWLTGGPAFVPRYGVVTLVGLSLAAGVGVTALGRRATPLAATVLLLAVGFSLVKAKEKFRKPDWKQAADFVDARAMPGDTVVVSIFYNGWSFDRHFTRDDVRRRNYDDFTIGKIFRGHDGMKRLWLVLNPLPGEPRFLEIDNPMIVASKTEFFGITVIELERQPD